MTLKTILETKPRLALCKTSSFSALLSPSFAFSTGQVGREVIWCNREVLGMWARATDGKPNTLSNQVKPEAHTAWCHPTMAQYLESLTLQGTKVCLCLDSLCRGLLLPQGRNCLLFKSGFLNLFFSIFRFHSKAKQFVPVNSFKRILLKEIASGWGAHTPLRGDLLVTQASKAHSGPIHSFYKYLLNIFYVHDLVRELKAQFLPKLLWASLLKEEMTSVPEKLRKESTK